MPPTSGKWEFPFASFASFFCLIQLHKAGKGWKRIAKGIQSFTISPYRKKAEKGGKRRLTQLFLSFMIFSCLYSTYDFLQKCTSLYYYLLSPYL